MANNSEEEFLTTILAPIELCCQDNKTFHLDTFVLNSQKDVKCSLYCAIIDDQISIILEVLDQIMFKDFKIYMDVDGKICETKCEASKEDLEKEKKIRFFVFRPLTNKMIKSCFINVKLIIIYSFYSKKVDVTKCLKIDLNNENFTDFTISTNDGKINVHKAILANSSPVFKAIILDNNTKEKATNNIDFSIWNTNVVIEFINYIYDKEYNLSVGVQELFKLAHMYEFEELQEECEKFMITFMGANDIVNALNLLETYSSLKDLEIKANNFIESHIDGLLKDHNFVECFLNSMNLNNINFRFQIAMKNSDEDFKSSVIKFIIDNAEEVFKNEEFKKFLLSNPNYNYEISLCLIKFKNSNVKSVTSRNNPANATF